MYMLHTRLEASCVHGFGGDEPPRSRLGVTQELPGSQEPLEVHKGAFWIEVFV